MEEKITEQGEYTAPKITDYGDLKELTAGSPTGTQTDVPLSTPVPPFSIFS
ncbi:MAG: lasso RiPP family leader peptide-containing protein [Chloroflexota bacterium]|nr:lasso RiPP family leader peptide-containing protein [Chloroflexota bacterium]